MNFKDLKQIIEEIQENITCRECEAPFRENDIRIIGTVLNEGYFLTHCRHCKNKMIINVILKTNRKHRNLKSSQRMKTIDGNDVLDMHNFLKSFNGDFINLFDKK